MKTALTVLFFIGITISMYVSLALCISLMFSVPMQSVLRNDMYFIFQLFIGSFTYGFMADEMANFYTKPSKSIL